MDRELIARKLLELERYVQALEGLRRHSLTELWSDLEKAWAIEHGLQLAIQVVIDTGNSLLAALGENRIEEYADVLDRLGERGILPAPFARQVRAMAGFRNILVHQYAAVDLAEVYHMLQTRLDDFRRFAEHVRAYMEHGATTVG